MKKVKSNAPRGGPSINHPMQANFSVDMKQSDDGVSRNLSRRGILDKSSKAKDKILHCKMHTFIATFNARTLKSENKRIELLHCFRSQGISILGIIDHKIVHKSDDNDIVYKHFGNDLFITSSAWRNNANAAVGGVGMVLDKKAENTLSDVKKWNNRIIIATFDGNPKTTVIVHYSPVEGDEESEDHYKHLSDAVRQVPKHNMLVVMGDFNAHLDRTIVKHSYHENSNSNGKIVKSFIQEADLFVANGHFQKKPAKLWTYLSDMSGRKTQVDYITINKKWKNSVHNCQSYNSFSSLGSDHRVVTAKIKLSFRKRQTKPCGDNHDWSVLRNEEEMKKQVIFIQLH